LSKRYKDYEQIPCSPRRNQLPVQLIDGTLLVRHEHLARALIELMQVGTIHAARNVGTGRAAELATYIVEKGKPLLTVVE
jgi:hypothetical protein